jgi:uncharacterized protein YbjT (DUF2867 family)
MINTNGHEGKTYLLTGPESLNGKDLAHQLSKVTLNPVSYVEMEQV